MMIRSVFHNTHEEDDLNVYRVLLVLGGIGKTLYALVIGYNGEDDLAFLFGRYIVSLLCFIAFGLTFTPRLSTNFKKTIAEGVFYIYMIHGVYISYLSHFPYHHYVTLMVIVVAISTVFRSRKRLIVFLLTFGLVYSLGNYFEPQPVEVKLSNIINNIFICIILFAINCFRLSAQRGMTSGGLFLRAMLNQTNDAIFLAEINGIILDGNRNMVDMFELPEGVSIAGKTVNEFLVFPANKDKRRQIVEHVRSGKHWNEEMKCLTMSGKQFYGEIFISEVWNAGKPYLLVRVKDISIQKETELELRNSRERFRLALEGANDGIWDWDLTTGVLFYSARYKSMLGLEEHELEHTLAAWEERLHPDDIAAAKKAIADYLEGATSQYIAEFRIKHKEGHYIWMLERGKAIYDDDHNAIRMLGSSTDITERKKADELLKQVMDSSPNAIIAYKAVYNNRQEVVDLECIHANKVAENIIEQNRILIGDRLVEKIPSVLEGGFFAKMVNVVLTGASLDEEVKFVLNGREHFLRIVCVRFGVDGCAVTYEDITLQREADLELLKLSLVASKTDNGVIITDALARIEWVNEGFTRITGYTLQEVVGMKPGRLLQGPGTDLLTVKRISDKLKNKESFTEELLNYHKDGHSYWLQLNVTPILDEAGEIQKYIAIESDITARKKAEAEIKLAKEEAEAGARAKSEFLATMSHEIRTPMNAVVGMTGLLSESELDEAQRDYVETIRTSGDNLLEIINDILDYSKIDSGYMELESHPFNMIDIIEDVFELLSQRAFEKGLELVYYFEPEVPVDVLGDSTRLRQILVNLISNAIKFTEKGEILVSVRSITQVKNKQTLEFTVRDTGIGIPADKANKLFRSFSQVDSSTTRKYGGTGLGLAISKKLVELMGGAIKVESKEGIGSSFIFTTDVEVNKDEEVFRKIELAKDLVGKFVVLIDDNRTNLKIQQLQFRKWGVETATYESPSDALHFIFNSIRRPNLVIVDMNLPDLESSNFMHLLRERYSKIDMPVIIVTSLGTMPEAQQRELYSAFITKPARQSQLYYTVSRLLNTQSRQKDAKANGDEKLQATFRKDIHILVAEDNLINQKVARGILTNIGFQIDIANNGKEALEMMLERKFDLVFMDMQMPEMDGVEATQVLRAMNLVTQPIIVAMTANAMSESRDICLAEGMDDYIAKPVKINDIRAIIGKWFPIESVNSEVV
jgi:PAS domain S-box-containing protein